MSRQIRGQLFLGILGLGTALFTASCKQEKPPEPIPQAIDFRKPLPEGMVALRKISPSEYPDFGAQRIDVMSVRTSIEHSLEYLAAPSSQAYFPYLDITHDRAVATLHRLHDVCDQLATIGTWNPQWFNQQIRDNFDVYKSYGAPAPDGAGFTDKVLFTGYHTPIYDASLVRTGPYQWPLYKLPSDLARNPNTGEVVGLRTPDGSVVPYFTRGEIETGGKLAGDELVWLSSRWEAYIVTIQGSARLRLGAGKIYEVGFAGTNGYDYTSPGRQMVADGVIPESQLSLRGLTAYFKAHPDMMDKYLPIDKRYVFFTERTGGPYGKLNVPVTALASIATDKHGKDIYPRAMPAFLQVPIPDPTGYSMRPFSGFLMDQDAGGAIRAAGRCDIYMGVGPRAEAMAGQELQQGALYYIAVKQEAIVPQVAPGAGGETPAGN